MSSIREKIIEAAIEEATPLPYGKVSDLVRDGEGRRAGWRNLKAYFDEAVLGWFEQKWQMKGEITLPSGTKKTITYLEGVQIPTYRVPQKSKPSGASWCGIFATWVLRRAGLHVFWDPFNGISGQVKYTTGNEGFAPGDVVVFHGDEKHHAIVVNENLRIYDGDDSLDTINGNSGAQSIERHSRFDRKKVAYYYKILD